MLTLVNTNRMSPPIAPIGLDYMASAVRQAGHEVEILDLGLTRDPRVAIEQYFDQHQPELVGLSFRNVDDCFWPSARWFVPALQDNIAAVRSVTDAPLVLGGVGFSIFPRELMARSQVEFGIWGDGDWSIIALLEELRAGQRWERVPGLIYRRGDAWHSNPPAWPRSLPVTSARDFVDNKTYFRLGGQLGVETKRGCGRRCIYCADPLAKGREHRLRNPAIVADEIAGLLAQGVDTLHLCDPEFNLPPGHAADVCQELIQKRLGERVRWYAYLAVTPFSADLARVMRRAGCVGINFTSDSAHPAILATYRQPHGKEHLTNAVRRCRENGIAVMLDMLLGGPGETEETVTDTIQFFKKLDPDCAGAALGIRIYPGTEMANLVASEGGLEGNPNIRRRGDGPVDLIEPTFYVASSLGDRPDQLIRDLIGDDLRFFPPSPGPVEGSGTAGDHNYSDNRLLVDAIAAGQRGAYWDILRRQGTVARRSAGSRSTA